MQPINPAAASPTSSLVKRAIAAHAALGTAISAVLYIICLSGTIAVFKDELHGWEQSGEPRLISLTPAAAFTAAKQALAHEPSSEHLIIQLPAPGTPWATARTDHHEFYIKDDGSLSLEANRPWSDFIVELHYYLHLPKKAGLIVVSIFGVMLFALSISGFIAHPKIFQEAFSFRRSKSEQLKQTDLHNRLSVWTAPFHLSNSLTGAVIGLAGISAVVIGQLNHNGNHEQVFEAIYGPKPAHNSNQAELARIDKALEHMLNNFPERPMTHILLHDPGTEGQYLQIMAEHSRRLIYAEKYNYDNQGGFTGTTGSADGYLGQQIADSVYKVHFGNYGGLPVKLAYGLFGCCLLLIITAGMKIYFLKRQARGRAVPELEAAWRAVVWGSPLMLLVTFGVSTLGGVTTSTLVAVFWVGILLIVLLKMTRHR